MLHGWCHVKCCRFSASSVYTIQPCTRLQCHFIQSHKGRVYVCLAVTCRLHFWQNDRVLLRATALTPGWNGYPNKSQHTKLIIEKKILPPLLRDSNPGPFDHESDALTTELSPLPKWAGPSGLLANQSKSRNLSTLGVISPPIVITARTELKTMMWG